MVGHGGEDHALLVVVLAENLVVTKIKLVAEAKSEKKKKKNKKLKFMLQVEKKISAKVSETSTDFFN